MTKEIKITVSGTSAAGTTNAIDLITFALQGLGYNVEHDASVCKERVRSVVDVERITRTVAPITNVIIGEQKTQRSGYSSEVPPPSQLLRSAAETQAAAYDGRTADQVLAAVRKRRAR